MELKIVFLVILAVVSAVYLTSLFFKHGLFQSILKGCLLPLVLAIYVFGAEKILLPIVLALVFGWAGDIFLLKISDLRCFRIGLASFLTGHLCYIIAMYKFILLYNIPVLFCSIAVAAIAGFFLFRIIRPNDEMRIPVIVYETVILIMVVFALQVFSSQGKEFGAFVFAGSLCFVVSDSLLAYDTFQKKTKVGYFLVMLTYILAQVFIALGFCSAV